MEPNEKSERPILRMILAGMASVVAGGTTHPIDTVKIRLQKEGEFPGAQKKYKNVFRALGVITREEGFLALYKGLLMSLSREASYSTLRLGLYEPYKKLLGANDPKNTPFWKKFSAGFLSGSTGAIVANPFDLQKKLKVRLQSLSKKSNLTFEVKQIFQQEGLKGLYKGVLPNILRGAILTGTKMATYDQTKYLLKKHFQLQEGIPLYLPCAFITGLALTITTAPVDLIKTRIMSQNAGKRVYNGIIDCAVKTVQKEGFKAFYKGFLPQWFRFGPFNIIQLMVWEKLRTLCGVRNL